MSKFSVAPGAPSLSSMPGHLSAEEATVSILTSEANDYRMWSDYDMVGTARHPVFFPLIGIVPPENFKPRTVPATVASRFRKGPEIDAPCQVSDLAIKPKAG